MPARSCDPMRTSVSALLPGQSTEMQPMPLHSLSELERASLQELALYRLQEKLLLGDLSLAKVGPKGSKSIRQKLESFSKEKKGERPRFYPRLLPAPAGHHWLLVGLSWEVPLLLAAPQGGCAGTCPSLGGMGGMRTCAWMECTCTWPCVCEGVHM
ncbi:rho GTPase-activating protein 6-like [Egretta garzetta]|uniref:rho GTPase-activating protein 6-like n=1 Tax=Egretta garzetta TaxID=188379 RepID=UPI00163C6C43|nr:rho GTPase-activating protein 6-like [Egretta garzetta]